MSWGDPNRSHSVGTPGRSHRRAVKGPKPGQSCPEEVTDLKGGTGGGGGGAGKGVSASPRLSHRSVSRGFRVKQHLRGAEGLEQPGHAE